MFCPNCGGAVTGDEPRCPRCGQSLALGRGGTEFIGEETSSSLSASFYEQVAPEQSRNLSAVVCDILSDYGAGIFKDPRRLTACARDCINEDDRIGMVFINNCVDEFLAIFSGVLGGAAANDVELAAKKAERYLCDRRAISEHMAHVVSQAIAKGVGDYMGVRVSFDGGGTEPKRILEKTVYCPNCGVQNGMDAIYCVACGYELRKPPADTVECPVCHTQNSVDDVYCTSCGRMLKETKITPPVPPPPAPQGPPAWLIAAVAGLVCVVIVFGLRVVGGGAWPWEHIPEPESQPDPKPVSQPELEPETTSEPEPEPDPESASQPQSQPEPESKPESQPEPESKPESKPEPQSESTPEPEPEPDPEPFFGDARASSFLADEADKNKYAAKNVLDTFRSTSWTEGAGTDKDEGWQNGSLKGSAAEKALGVGEWIELYADEEQHVSGLRIINGYSKKKDDGWEDRENGDTFYYDNPRVKDIAISFSDGTQEEARLEDAGPGKWQDVPLKKPHDTTYVKITIKSVYDTSKNGERTTWPDTAIDEIEVY